MITAVIKKMNIVTHLSIAVFLGLLLGKQHTIIFIAGAHLLPLADIVLVYFFGYRALHTSIGFLVVTVLYFANFPFIAPYLTLSTAVHLITDLFSKKGLHPFQPFHQKKITFPLQHSERVLLITGLVGSSILLLIRLF